MSRHPESELDELFDMVDMEDFLGIEAVDYRVTPGTSGVQLNIKECPRCGGNEWKVYLNCDTGFGNCFHGSCVDEPGYNKFSFIKATLGVTNGKVITYVKNYVTSLGWRPKKTIAVETTNNQEVILPDHYPLPINGSNITYLSRRGIPTSIAEYFGWLYCHSGFFEFTNVEGKKGKQSYDRRVIIPIYNLEGDLVTFQGRDITGTADKKYLFPPKLAGSGRYLYNAQNCIGLEHIVVNEGAFDVAATKMALDTQIDLRKVGCVGTFGKHISEADGESQTKALLDLKALGLKKVTLMWDSEKKTLDDACKAATHLKALGLVVYLAILPKGKDPNECSADQVVSAFVSAFLCTSANLLKFRIKNMRSS